MKILIGLVLVAATALTQVSPGERVDTVWGYKDSFVKQRVIEKVDNVQLWLEDNLTPEQIEDFKTQFLAPTEEEKKAIYRDVIEKLTLTGDDTTQYEDKIVVEGPVRSTR